VSAAVNAPDEQDQPLCPSCWRIREGTREPPRPDGAQPEICSQCGRLTTSGIYLRIDPDSVRYPRLGRA
jgi:hypothetical protein